MAGHLLAVRSLFIDSEFNWVFLLWHIVCGILAILFLFYFNRIFASIVSFGIRLYTWHYYRVHIDIQALQFSLLAGRLFFKGVRYNGKNETILIQDGYITWRYWLRRVQELDCGHSGKNSSALGLESNSDNVDGQEGDPDRGEAGEAKTAREKPCRVLIRSRGVQWFIYNRSPAYDSILRSMNGGQDFDNKGQKMPDSSQTQGDQIAAEENLKIHNAKYAKDGEFPSFVSKEESIHDFDNVIKDEELNYAPSQSSAGHSNVSEDQRTSSLPSLLNILPIRIECNKGAIVMGNQSTRSILTAKFDSTAGQIDARASHTVDQYNQRIDLDFVHPVIQFKHNKEFKETQIETGAKIRSDGGRDAETKIYWYQRLNRRRPAHEVWSWLRKFFPYHRGSVESSARTRSKSAENPTIISDAVVHGPDRWLGLTRYLDDDDEYIEQERWRAIEYAQFHTIVDSPGIGMSFHWDVPGLVPETIRGSRGISSGYESDINGDVAPDWGIDLRIRGGTVNYGPWADRQRANLQAVFFPTLYKDTTPAERLSPGQSRVSTELKIMIEVEEQTTLRIPTREDSKDWRWKGRTSVPSAKDDIHRKKKSHTTANKNDDAIKGLENRPFGWLDVKVSPDSTVSLVMDLVSGSSGYKNRVTIDLRGIEMSSSINHGLLLRSQSQVISCDLSNPLKWNTLRRWHIDIQDQSLELFLLRDHVFLLTDLINDWTSGPQGNYFTFVPFEYSLGLRFMDFKLYLNANDSNIIDNPADIDDNTFVIIWGQELDAKLVIPMRTFRPARNEITFDVKAHDGGFELRTPAWNTQNTFLASKDVAALKRLKLDGSYNYFTTTSPDLTDILLLNVHGASPRIELYGFLIRYLMKIKDNYFGEDLHFRTLEEYQNQILKAEGAVAEARSEQHSRLSNDLDVILGITAEKSRALLPTHLYSASDNVCLDISSISADLRFTNYYMDLAVCFSPIAISTVSDANPSQSSSEDESSTQLFIDGLEVFGHRLFGLPPTEPTYVCNWDFDVGCTSGECSVEFLRGLIAALRCFALSFADAENALPPPNPLVIHDVTFLRAKLQPIVVGLQVENTVFLVSTQEVKVEYNDWAGNRFSDRLHAWVPGLTLAVVDIRGASKDRGHGPRDESTHAYMQATIEVNKVSRKLNFESDRQLQQNHIALHDSRTRRVPWLFRASDYAQSLSASAAPTKIRAPAMPFPKMPEPVATKNGLVNDVSSATSSNMSRSSVSILSRKSSFLDPTSIIQNGSRQEKNETVNKLRMRAGSKRPERETEDPGAANDTQALDKSWSQPPSQISSGNVRKDQGTFENGIPHSGFAFSSPYKRPYFPLLAVQPDTKDVPALPEGLSSDDIVEEVATSEVLDSQTPNQDSEQTGFMVCLRHGVRVFCTPEALLLATRLQEILQMSDITALLDDLQISVMAEVLGTNEKRGRGSRATDVRIFTPFVAARFVSTVRDNSQNITRQDRYEVRLENLTTTLRSSGMFATDSQAKLSYQLSLHAFFDQLHCSAKESVVGQKPDQAVVSLSLFEPVLWMFRDTSSSAELQFRDLEVASASRKVDYISSLMRGTVLLSEKLASRFSRVARKQKSRLRLLVLLLTKEWNDLPDPAFLSGASYVLRSTNNHLRSSDSWKMISRLRHVHRSLPSHAHNRIRGQCTHRWASCPADAGGRVIASFDSWRTWDLKSVRSSILMRKLYGRSLSPSSQLPDVPKPLMASIRAGQIRVLVEPGPNQNEVAIDEFVLGVDLYHPLPSTDTSSVRSTMTPGQSVVQAHCAKLATRLNWSLFELLENIVETMQATHAPESENKETYAVRQTSVERSCWHIAVSSDTAILNLDSITLRIISLCQRLKGSIVILKGRNSYQDPLRSLAISADAATSEIRSRTSTLTVCNLLRPSIFGSRDDGGKDGFQNPWRFVGSGKEISFQIPETPLGMIEIADGFLRNEVAHILTWVKSLQPETRQSSEEPIGSLDLLKAHVALFLDSYLISIALTPSLTYQIYGTGARSAITSAMQRNSGIAIDLDLKDHAHVFKTGVKEISNELSILHIPPINGRLTLDLALEQKSVILRALAEPIVFEASAVHAIIIVLNRPEIVNLGKSIGQEVSALQDLAKQIFNLEKTNIDKSFTPEPLLYDAYITLAGLAIHASTPDSTALDQAAEFDFNMGRIQMKATNGRPGLEAVDKFPEFEIRLGEVKLKLMRSNDVQSDPCGEVSVEVIFKTTFKPNDSGRLVRAYQISCHGLEVNLYTETASVVVAILGHLQDTLKTIDISDEVKNLGKLGRARLWNEAPASWGTKQNEEDNDPVSTALFNAMYSLEMTKIRVTWKIGRSIPLSPDREAEDLILSFSKIDLATRKDNAARLLIEDFQLQMSPPSRAAADRSSNSALLPEVVFNVAYLSTSQGRRLAFQAIGKSLDLRITSQSILPANDLRRSIALASDQLRTATAKWNALATATDGPKKGLIGSKRLASLLVDSDFAGAVVYIQGQNVTDPHSLALSALRGARLPQHGRYNQFTPENADNSSTTLRAPSIAFKIEYKDAGIDEKTLNAELKIDASTNVLNPTVVPLIMEISSSIKEIVGESNEQESRQGSKLPQPKFLEGERLRTTDPNALLGNCRLNLGLRICRQEFSLSCQPIARVAATARFEDIYITVNTVQSPEHGKFFTISAAFTGIQASVQHVYSRESTGNFDVDSIVISLMNSKHVSAANGISVILNISPMKAQINAKQLQDFLLFWEIWVPPEIRQTTTTSEPISSSEPQVFIVQRYQQVAAAGAFPWNATVSIAELDVQLDLGQSLGKSAFVISQLWVSSNKSSDWEQNLCLGFDKVSVNSAGRMSGFVEMQNFKVRTSIQWPVMENAHNQTPLVQASLGFQHLRIKAGFDFQAFVVADVTTFEFLMYNVRNLDRAGRDRLVGVLDGDKVQVFCTTTSASQALALYQAFQRLIQEKQAAYETSLRDIEKFLRRKSSLNPYAIRAAAKRQAETGQEATSSPLRLQTDVVVTLKAVNLGAFPSTFFDNQIFKMEALDASARFAVVLDQEKIHSTLGMTLGQLRIALSGISRANVPKTLGEVSVAEVVTSATGSRGGTILKVPKLVATMQTWQDPDSTHIDYIFKSSFQGRVDVGWNYSRISHIRGMWSNHARALAQRLGKPLPPSAVQITGLESEDGIEKAAEGEHEKITAVVNVPQSKYQYTALQPAIIETPQLRDMGEATPPLEWIGLHRDRLPNLTHQIVIITLLEVAKEVDDAYSRILGSS